MVARSKLTPKQEKFAQGIAKGLNLSDAYRASYDAGGMSDAVINNKASLLSKRGDVRVRVDELREPVIKSVGITLESHLNDLLELRRLASEDGQFSAAISAEVARGKAAGIIVDKTQITGSNGGALEIKLTKEYID